MTTLTTGDKALTQEVKDSAVGTLSNIIGPTATQSILRYIDHSTTLNNPEELHFLLTLLFGEVGAPTLERELLASLSRRLGEKSPEPTVQDSSFDIKQAVKKSISFNRMHAIVAALQPRDVPRPDADARLTATDGLTPNTEVIQSAYAGAYFHSIFEKVRRILAHQLSSKDRTAMGIKGFIFQGPPGTGKTTMGRAIARHFALEFVYVDSSTVARSRYGESEKQVLKAFEDAKRRASLVLIDDAEAIFPSRDSTRREEFYSGQNNVIFHQLDVLDTSKTVVILTTNKPEQLDPALRDRLYGIQFPELDTQTIMEIATLKCRQRNIPPDEVLQMIRESPHSVKSIRSLEKMITEQYVLSIERAEFTARKQGIPHPTVGRGPEHPGPANKSSAEGDA